MIIGAVVVIAATYACGHWLAGAAVAVLLFGWRVLATAEGPPVLALAFTYQWVQVSIGLFYSTLTGDVLETIESSAWERMMLLGLGCLTALAAGIRGGQWLSRRKWPADPHPPVVALTWTTMVAVYVGSILVVGVVQEIAWKVPAFTQAIIGLTFARLALLFLLTRRLVAANEWRLVTGLLIIEVALGFTGYFASFREPLVMGAIAGLEVFDRRRVAHWVGVAALLVVVSASSLMWIGVRRTYRQDFDAELFAASRTARLIRITELSTGWLDQDNEELQRNVHRLVDRMWAIYYPALALARVPSLLPHTNGEITIGALRHLVTPRALFPDKPELPSDSEMVRKYSGVYVAGAEQNTSIAFGYAIESYLDFGIPLMFLPSLAFGLLMGAAHHWFIANIRHRELAIGLVTVVFWLGLYLFERSWVKTLGLNVTLMVYLGGITFLLDRWLMIRTVSDQELDAKVQEVLLERSGH